MVNRAGAFTSVTHEFTADMSRGELDRKRTLRTDLEFIAFRHGFVENLLLALTAHGDERSSFLFVVFEALRAFKLPVAVFAVHPFTDFAV